MTAEQHPTQADAMLAMLEAAGTDGVHTFTLRRAFIGNPSQRRDDLERRGVSIVTGPRERLHGRAFGVRYWLEEHAPEHLRARKPHALTEIDDRGAVRLAV
jgi:hypothetical protein